MSNTTTTNGIGPIYYNADADRYYRDVDGIRLVYEAYDTHGAKHCGKLVGYYRPDLEEPIENPEPKPGEGWYGKIAMEMLE